MTTTTSSTDTEVTTIVQQIDAQGPAVVQHMSTQFADVACSPDNVQKLVEALRSGGSVTLSDSSGKSSTFSLTGANLGYGEAYIALALAAEALKSAGVTGCATADQWKSVLLGGPLSAAGGTSTSTTTTASASSSSNFPGIIALHSQGQGWGQIAQKTNVQLGQVVSSARTSLNLEASGTSGLSPTGRSSSEMNPSRSTSSSTDSSSSLNNSSTSTSTTPTTSGTTSTTPSTSATSGTTSTTPDSTPSSTSSGPKWNQDDSDKPGKGQGKGKGHQNDTPGHRKHGDDTSSSSPGSSSSSSSAGGTNP